MNYVDKLEEQKTELQEKINKIDLEIENIQANCKHEWVEQQSSITYFQCVCSLCNEVSYI